MATFLKNTAIWFLKDKLMTSIFNSYTYLVISNVEVEMVLSSDSIKLVINIHSN